MLHNIRAEQKRQERIEDAGGVRHFLAKSEQDRKGPKKRVDDPKWGEQRRVVEGPDALAFGQVVSSDGARIPTKLAPPTRLGAPLPQAPGLLAPPDPIAGPVLTAMAEKLERPMHQLWEHMIEETGPLILADAVSWLREQGAALDDY